MNRADGIAVRLLRSWHGRPVGAVLRPPGSIRQVLLESKDANGTPFGEIVDERVAAPKAPAEDLAGSKPTGRKAGRR